MVAIAGISASADSGMSKQERPCRVPFGPPGAGSAVMVLAPVVPNTGRHSIRGKETGEAP
jgi:hypothetical protein